MYIFNISEEFIKLIKALAKVHEENISEVFVITLTTNHLTRAARFAPTLLVFLRLKLSHHFTQRTLASK